MKGDGIERSVVRLLCIVGRGRLQSVSSILCVCVCVCFCVFVCACVRACVRVVSFRHAMSFSMFLGVQANRPPHLHFIRALTEPSTVFY